MKTKPKLDMEKIAKHLRADRGGQVQARSGHFGAQQLVADVRGRLRSPARGGRATDPSWTEQRLIRLAPKTLVKLEHLSEQLRSKEGVDVQPIQVAALLLERAVEQAEAANDEQALVALAAAAAR